MLFLRPWKSLIYPVPTSLEAAVPQPESQSAWQRGRLGPGRLLLARWIMSSLCLRFQPCPLVATVAQPNQQGSLLTLTLSLAAIDLSLCSALPPPPISSQLCGSEVTDQVTGAKGVRAGGPWLIGIQVPVSPLPPWS